MDLQCDQFIVEVDHGSDMKHNGEPYRESNKDDSGQAANCRWHSHSEHTPGDTISKSVMNS